jgi:hypothetical protein
VPFAGAHWLLVVATALAYLAFIEIDKALHAGPRVAATAP